MTRRHSSSTYVKYSSSSLLDSRSDGSPIFATTSGPGHWQPRYGSPMRFTLSLLVLALACGDDGATPMNDAGPPDGGPTDLGPPPEPIAFPAPR